MTVTNQKLTANRQDKSTFDFLVGIDPGSKDRTGVSTYNINERRLKYVSSTTVLNLIIQLNKLKQKVEYDISGIAVNNRFAVVIENPALDSTVYGAADRILSEVKNAFYDRKQTFSTKMNRIKSVVSVCLKIAQDVGRNKHIASMIIEFCEENGIPIVQIAPSSRDKAYRELYGKKRRIDNVNTLKMPTKTDQKQFRDLTGWTESTNEHGRDAATLIYNQSPAWVRLQLALQSASQAA